MALGIGAVVVPHSHTLASQSSVAALEQPLLFEDPAFEVAHTEPE